ncbi:MAG TPA: hypothetical protein VMQ44_02910 [Candidatus Saccharimonadales bacterium]|nr:hypothetical protein [Candidatus Saccharimonadales bacterium]
MDEPIGEQSQQPTPAPSQPAAPAPAPMTMPEEKKGSWVTTLVWIVVLAVVIYGVIWYIWLR